MKKLLILIFVLVAFKSIAKDDCTTVTIDAVKHTPISDQDGLGYKNNPNDKIGSYDIQKFGTKERAEQDRAHCVPHIISQIIDAISYITGDNKLKKAFENINSKMSVATSSLALYGSIIKALYNLPPGYGDKRMLNGKQIKISEIKKLTDLSLEEMLNLASLSGESCSYNTVRSKFGQKDLKEYMFDFRNLYRDYGYNSLSSQENTKQCLYDASPALGFNMPPHKLFSALRKDTFLEYFRDIYANLCEGHTRKIPSWKTYVIDRRNTNSKEARISLYKALMKKALSKGNKSIPFIIGYCANILHEEIKGEHILENGKPSKECMDLQHVGSVSGRKFNTITGKCEYTIRGTYGTSCHMYENVRCKDGEITLNRDDVIKNTLSATFIRINKNEKSTISSLPHLNPNFRFTKANILFR